MDKRNLKALVCGASKGIGRAIALELSRKGYLVTALARDAEALGHLVKEMGVGHQFVVLDFANDEQVQTFFNQHKMDYDILICNSGGPQGGPLTEAPVEQFQKAFQQHLYFNHQIMQACIPHMKENKFGRIITILSTSVKAPLPNLGVSNVLRAAVASWAKTLSNELGSYGITVNNVLPGYTETDRLHQLMEGAARRLGSRAEDVQSEWISSVPMKRFAEPEELAAAVCFLASKEAAYINGINLPVDGGRLQSL